MLQKKACSQVATKKTGGRSNKSARRLQGVCRQVEAGVKHKNYGKLKGQFQGPGEDEKLKKLVNAYPGEESESELVRITQ